ncbi:MAG: hypothetical protein NG747_02000 [Candidatus Brocadia sp.]|nr:hypothetical protein [Candidatus Brocadia sp.]
MNKAIISFIIVAGLLAGCKDDNHKHGNAEHGHVHGEEVHTGGEIEPHAYTLYTDKSELFVEFKPLIVGETSRFAAHFTQVGETFKAVTEGSVTVSLIRNGIQLTDKAEAPSYPGIFRLALNPENPGTYQLVFDIQTKEYSDKITIADITVCPDTKTALTNQQKQTIGEEIVYLKEQAWKIDFANREVKRQPFAEIIKTTGQVLHAPGDKTTIIAKSKGVITFGNNKILIGSAVNAGETLFIISGAGLTEGNLDTKYKEAKNNYEKSKMDFERAEKLVKDHIISQKYFSKFNSISSANFITANDSKIYRTDSLNGKLVSYGKSVDNNAYYIPVNFEIDNNGEIIPGSFVEVLLKTNVIRNALVIPYSALIEEQGNYFAYVQTSGEGFQKRELIIGVNDGMNVQVLAGIKEGERVVTKGAYQIKLATMSGKMPAHGHEH